MPNPFTEFLYTIGGAVGELGKEALVDVRTTWEEAWFGKELTPEPPGSPAGDPLGRFEQAVEKVGDDLELVGREGVNVIESVGKRIETAFDKLFDELARERESRGAPDHEHEQGIER